MKKKIEIEFYNNDYGMEVGDYYKDDCQEILVNAKIIWNVLWWLKKT